MGIGLQHEALRGSGASEPGVLPAASASPEAGIELGEAFQETGAKIFRPPEGMRSLGFVIELFSGCARVSIACSKVGFTSIAFDIEYDSKCDLLSRRLQRRLVRFMKKHWHRHSIALIWLGTPCTSWSRARRLDGGPPPLRDDEQFLFGFKDLHPLDAAKVNLGFWKCHSPPAR